MNYVKKLSLVPIFILTLALFFNLLKPLLGSTEILFSLNSQSLIVLLILSGLLVVSALLMVIFMALAQDPKIILPVILLTTAIPLVFSQNQLGLILFGAIFISLLITYFSLNSSLKNYLTFNPSKLFTPSVKTLTTFLIISFSIGYFLAAKASIDQNGFNIPDSLVEMALKLSPQLSDQTLNQVPKINLSKEQIDLLKKNPNLLKQSGIDPGILDLINQPNPQNNLLKEMIKTQFQQAIKPYISFLPAILAVIFYSLLAFGSWILSFFIGPTLMLIFYLMEKTGYIKFTTETKQVKKLII